MTSARKRGAQRRKMIPKRAGANKRWEKRAQLRRYLFRECEPRPHRDQREEPTSHRWRSVDRGHLRRRSTRGARRGYAPASLSRSPRHEAQLTTRGSGRDGACGAAEGDAGLRRVPDPGARGIRGHAIARGRPQRRRRLARGQQGPPVRDPDGGPEFEFPPSRTGRPPATLEIGTSQ